MNANKDKRKVIYRFCYTKSQRNKNKNLSNNVKKKITRATGITNFPPSIDPMAVPENE